MPTLRTVVDAYVSSNEFDQGTLSRLAYWVETFGNQDLLEITPDEVDAAVVRLAERGKLRGGRGLATERANKPLAGSTLNRYIGQLAQVYKYARRLRLLPRAHVPPTRGIEKAPENTHHDRYFTPEEVDRMVKIARALDTRWGKMEALIILAYHTGLRKTNLLNLRWTDIDFVAGTLTVLETKNGDPMVAALTNYAASLLQKLPRGVYVFEHAHGKPYEPRRLWNRVIEEAGFKDKTFHSLRHSCGHRLAASGASQAMIMKYMGHRSLAASARYMHVSTTDKQRVAMEVFG
jgi:integrase